MAGERAEGLPVDAGGTKWMPRAAHRGLRTCLAILERQRVELPLGDLQQRRERPRIRGREADQRADGGQAQVGGRGDRRSGGHCPVSKARFR